MENSAKALEYAFAIFVFVIALTVSIYLFSTVRATSDIVFGQIDSKQYYTDVELPKDELKPDGTIKYGGRVINIATIVPALYRDYKENYIIEFYNIDRQCIIRFDLSEENSTRQIWTGNPNVDVKKRLDLFLQGSHNYMQSTNKGIINYQQYDTNDIAFQSNISSSDRMYIVTNGLYKYCEEKRFTEEFAFVYKKTEGKITEEVSKIVIRYIEVEM